MTALIVSNEEMGDIMKIVKSLEESGLLTKEISETIKNESKKQTRGYLSMLLGTLAASTLGNLLIGKEQQEQVKAQLEQPHPLINFEILNEPKFNGVYSRNSLSEIKDGAYIINLDEYESIETLWIALYVNAENVTYFDSFGVEKFIGNKNIITNIYRMQAYDSIIYGYFCIGFIDFMLKGKGLLEYIN